MLNLSMMKIKKLQLCLVVGVLAISCNKSGQIGAFVASVSKKSFSGVSSIKMESDGSFTISWSAVSDVKLASYSVYQLDLGASSEVPGSIEEDIAVTDGINPEINGVFAGSTQGKSYKIATGITKGRKYAFQVTASSADVNIENTGKAVTAVAAKTLASSTTEAEPAPSTPTNNTNDAGVVKALQDKIDALISAGLAKKQVKIIASGVGAASTIGTSSVQIGSSLTLRAALYDMSDHYLQDATVFWSMSNGAFSTSDLSVSPVVAASTVTFTPTSLGATLIQAIYSGSDTDVTKTSSVTGAITATSTQVATSAVVYSGANQAATVGATLSQPLRVQILDALGLPMSGVGVTFSVISGGGAIVTGASTTTNSSGIATATASLGNTAGANYFRAAVTTNASVNVTFIETGIAGAAASVAFAVQPSGTSDYLTAFSTQPVVTILDSNGNIASVSGSVVLSVQTGTGTITGTSAVTASNGIATFTGLGYSKAENAVVWRATYAGLTANSSAFNVAVGNKKVVIIADGAGTAAAITTNSQVVGTGFTLRAALFDMSDVYIADVPVQWSFSNATFPAGDLSVGTGASSATVVFTPSVTGTTVIQASYPGSDSTVTIRTDVTGTLTSTTNGTPASMAITAGNNQTGNVDTNLATDLSVRVLDTFSNPLQGVNITFSVLSGGGSIVTSQPSVTNSSGIATATVRLGSVVLSNTFRAAVASNTSINSTFTATATPGTPTQAIWTQAPATCFSNAPCGTQPMITIKDTYNNIVTSAVGSVTIARVSGCTTVSGTTTANLSGGTATFSNIGCTSSGAAVLRATYGSVTGDSASFTVSAAPPGACLLNDAYFTTAGGGCQDVTSGLTWSVPVMATYTPYQIVWDSQFAPNSGTEDAGDLGRTNDYDLTPAGSTMVTDPHSTNYCHSLVEGGQSDWRMPSWPDFATLYANLNGTGRTPPYLTNQNNSFFTSRPRSINASYFLYSLATNDGSNFSTSVGNAICVRGGRTEPSTIAVTSAPSNVGVGSARTLQSFPITVQIRDSLGNNVSAQNRTITVSSSLGTIGGTTTATTDINGTATFNAFTLDTVGTATLTFTGGGTSGTYSMKVGAFPHTCALEDSNFTTADGGCKQVGTGKVWSLPAPATMSWYDAIWGYVVGTFNMGDPPDADDGARTNDYDPAFTLTGGIDNSTINYCHSLNEGGKTDWRVPTCAELVAVASSGSGAATHFNLNSTAYLNANGVWGSNSNNCTGHTNSSSAGGVTLSTGLIFSCAKNLTTGRVYCIRP